MTCEASYDIYGEEVVPLDSLLPKMLERTAGVPYEMAVDMIRSKYIDFARRTGCIRKDLLIDLQRGVSRYAVPIPEGYLLHSMQDPQTSHTPGAAQTWGVWGGYRYTLDAADYINLSVPATQDVVEGLQVRAQLVPRLDCDTIPVKVATMYGDALGAGAAGEAMNIRGKPWYDPGNSVRVMRIFHQAVNDARANVERGGQSKLYMRAHRWV